MDEVDGVVGEQGVGPAGKPPYGYRADKLRHPVKAKAREGRTKHRLAADPELLDRTLI